MGYKRSSQLVWLLVDGMDAETATSTWQMVIQSVCPEHEHSVHRPKWAADERVISGLVKEFVGCTSTDDLQTMEGFRKSWLVRGLVGSCCRTLKHLIVWSRSCWYRIDRQSNFICYVCLIRLQEGTARRGLQHGQFNEQVQVQVQEHSGIDQTGFECV